MVSSNNGRSKHIFFYIYPLLCVILAFVIIIEFNRQKRELDIVRSRLTNITNDAYRIDRHLQHENEVRSRSEFIPSIEKEFIDDSIQHVVVEFTSEIYFTLNTLHLFDVGNENELIMWKCVANSDDDESNFSTIEIPNRVDEVYVFNRRFSPGKYGVMLSNNNTDNKWLRHISSQQSLSQLFHFKTFETKKQQYDEDTTRSIIEGVPFRMKVTFDVEIENKAQLLPFLL